jgi:hypothetical protein
MKNMKIKILAVGASVLMLASCLKEATMNTDPSKATNVIELANTGDNTASSGLAGYYSDLGVLGAGDTSNFNINVHYTGPGEAPTDIVVTLANDETSLSTYNTTNGTSFVTPPATVLTYPKSVTIKRGTSQTTVKATVKLSADFDFNKAYGVPIKITAVSSGLISGNYAASVYSFGVRNKYDGVYTLKGYHTRVPYNYPYSGITMEMRTVGATAVGFYWPAAGSFGHPIGVGPGSVSWYGAGIAPVVVFDAASNNVTNVFNQGSATPISIYTGAGSGQGRQAADKTMYIYFRYNANDARGFIDTLQYVSPR